MRSPRRKRMRSGAATEPCRDRQQLSRKFMPARTWGQEKHRQDQSSRKQTVLAKRLQNKRLNSNQECRNHQRRARKIENRGGHPIRSTVGIFEDFERGQAEHQEIKTNSKPGNRNACDFGIFTGENIGTAASDMTG